MATSRQVDRILDANIGHLGLNILVLTSDEARLHRAQTIRARHGLLTNDSLIVAAMEEFGIRNLATRDNDFDHVSELNVYKPTDI
jgi:predicted nucleic acid-binding protein